MLDVNVSGDAIPNTIQELRGFREDLARNGVEQQLAELKVREFAAQVHRQEYLLFKEVGLYDTPEGRAEMHRRILRAPEPAARRRLRGFRRRKR